MATEKKQAKHALYMMKKDGNAYSRAELIHADDVEEKRKAGYVEPIGQKANGAPWNEEGELDGQTAAAELAKKAAERKSKKDAERAAELEKLRKEQEALPKAQDRPDFKVEIVEAPKPEVAKKK